MPSNGLSPDRPKGIWYGMVSDSLLASTFLLHSCPSGLVIIAFACAQTHTDLEVVDRILCLSWLETYLDTFKIDAQLEITVAFSALYNRLSFGPFLNHGEEWSASILSLATENCYLG